MVPYLYRGGVEVNSKEDIRPISYVKANAAEILDQVNETHRPVYITQNGEARAVLLDPLSFEKMKKAMYSLSELLLTIQGDGDYEAAKQMVDEKGFIREELQKDLDRIGDAGIPRDIVFEQGEEILGLK